MAIKIVDRYIVREFLRTLVGIFFMVSVVLMIYILIESYGDIIENDTGWLHVALFFLFSLPYLIFQSIPMVIALATIYSIGSLARKKETMVMITSGINPVRIAVPLLILGAAFSIMTFYFNENVVPYCESKARYIQKIYVEGKSEQIITRNQDIFMKGKGNRFYIMKDFDSATNVMSSPLILDVNGEGGFLQQKIEADKAELVKLAGNKNAWRFTGYTKHTYDNYGKLLNIETSQGSTDVLMEDNLEKFLSNRKKAEEMNFLELRSYLNILYQRGERNASLETDLYMKLTFPWACLIVILICYSYAIKAQVHTLIISMGQGIGLIVVYYASVLLFQGFGHNALISPLVAAFLPTAAFLLYGAFLLVRHVK